MLRVTAPGVPGCGRRLAMKAVLNCTSGRQIPEASHMTFGNVMLLGRCGGPMPGWHCIIVHLPPPLVLEIPNYLELTYDTDDCTIAST